MIAIFVDLGISLVFKSRIFDNYTVQFLNGYSLNQTPHLNLIDGMLLYVGNEIIIHHHHKDHHYHYQETFMSLTGSQLEFAVSCSLKAPSNVARISSI